MRQILLATLFLGGVALTDSFGQSTQPAVFVTNNVGDSLTSFTVNPDGTLNRVNVFPSGDGPQAISLSPDGRFLAVGHGTMSTTTEELAIFRVNADATLTHRLTTLVPDSPLDVQWLANDVLAVTQTSIFVGNNVQTFRYDDGLANLSPIDIATTGSFNSRLATARNGALLYANNTNGGNSVFAFGVQASGELDLIENEATGSLIAVSMTATHDGNFLYGAGGISGDGNRILGWSIDGQGALSPLPGSTFTSPGESPKVIALTDDGQRMVVGHGTDATFWSFLRETSTGNLQATSNFFDVGLQGTLADLQIMGDLLFVTDSSTAIDGITGIYSFRFQADGSFQQLGPIQETLGGRPEYIATWPGESLICDFDLNSACNLSDLNLLLAEGPLANGVPVTPGVNEQFDLNGDGLIDPVDRNQWLSSAATANGLASSYKLGDSNLDGFVDGTDFNNWNAHKFTASLRWDDGDFTSDGSVDGSDFNQWNGNKFTSSDGSLVPEPWGLSNLILGLFLVVAGQRPFRCLAVAA